MSTIDKALDLLDILVDAEGPLGLSEVVARADMPKATVRRLLLSLIGQSLAIQDAQGKYGLGGLSVDLASKALSRISLVNIARPALSTLRGYVRGTITLSRYSDHGLAAVSQVEASASPFLVSPTSSAPMYATASGKAILAYLMQPDVERVTTNGMTAVTPKTLQTPADLEAELLAVRTRGYAIEDEEAMRGVRALAAPIRTFAHRPVGAVSVAAPAKILSLPELDRMAAHIVAAADQISFCLGGEPLAHKRPEA